MKNTFAALVLLLTLQIHAQIPDTLGVELPWPAVRFSSCDDTMGEGPKTETENVFIYLESDLIEEDASGNCLNRKRKWIILDWTNNEAYTFTQLGLINFPEPLMCIEELVITYEELPYVLNKENVLINPDQNHEYSFSFDDLQDVERVLELGGDANYDLYMYDHTASRICKLEVYITQCEEDIVLTFPETAAIDFNLEPYIELTPEMLGIDIVYPCGTFTTKIFVGNSNNNLLLSSSVGKIILIKVEIKFNDGSKYAKVIEVTVGGIKPDPIDMFIEEKSFTAGETIFLEVWSKEILGLIVWQLQLQFVDAEVISIGTSEMFDDIPFNILEDESTIRALWTPFDVMPIDVVSDATWFTLALKTNIDGSTLDIFNPNQDPWSLIGIEDENYIYEYEAEFVFNVAPRIKVGVDDKDELDNIQVFPNPTSDYLNITGLSNLDLPSEVNVYNLEGKLMVQEKVRVQASDVIIDISNLPTDIFILKIQNKNKHSSHKISKF